jgi:signal transduction histidine kinase
MTSGLATAAMAAVVREFEIAWERERQANILVQQERDTLEMRVEERTEELSERNSELSQTLSNLKNTQRQLIEAEKMAALGGLVAGVAHEINTPIGIGVTAASTLADETKLFLNDYQNGQIKRSALSHYLDIATDSSRLILRNLERAAELVQSFKQVAVDQTNLEQREFAVIGYIQEVLRSLHPQIKRFNHHIEVRGDETITLNSYPGAFSQVVTNLVMNSLMHAYPDEKSGKLRFEVTDQAGIITVGYQDDGCGISQENLPRIFEPFYTTARNRGGTGLGLHIVYNLITQKLEGQIRCESQVGLGTSFVLLFPKT